MSILIDSISFSYGSGKPVLRDISLEIEVGEVLLILGHNGAGKSTFLKLLNGINHPTSGSITVGGHDSRTTDPFVLAREVAVTFQNPSDQIFASTVRKELEFGPTNLHRPDPSQLVEHASALFQFTKKMDRHPYDLSLADRKLLTVASAVATGSPFLAFDEPTAGLSQPERMTLHSAIDHLKTNERTLVIVSHDLEFFLPLATRIVIFQEGRITYEGGQQMLMERKDELRTVGLRLPIVVRIEEILRRESV